MSKPFQLCLEILA